MGAVKKIAGTYSESIMSIPEGKILDFLTRKLVNDTPEEYVRQNIEKALVRQYRYPAEDCEPEFSIKVGSSNKVFKPSGRYKTNYVEKDYGHPLLSGRQLLQNQIVGLKYLPRASKNNYSGFLLKKGCVVYPADGRVEGRLGTPVLVTPSREGWYASGHIGRIEPLPGIDPGYLYLALSHPVVQEQISSLACGSVVDAVYPEDVEKIIIPAQIEFQYNRVVNAWNKFDEADALKQKACKLLLTQFGC